MASTKPALILKMGEFIGQGEMVKRVQWQYGHCNLLANGIELVKGRWHQRWWPQCQL